MTLYLFFSLVVFLLYAQAGIFLLLKKPVVKVNRLFACMLFALAWISLFMLLIQFADDLSAVYLLDRVNMFGWLALPLLTVLFFVEVSKTRHKAIHFIVYALGSLAVILMLRYMLHPQSLKVFYKGSSGLWYFQTNIQSGWVMAAMFYNLGSALLGMAMVGKFFLQTMNTMVNKTKIQSRVFMISFFLFLLISISGHIVFPLMGVAALPAMVHLAALPLIGAILLSNILLHPQTFFREVISWIFIRRIKEFVFFIDHNGLIYSANQHSLDVLQYNLTDMVNKDPGHFLKPSAVVKKKMEDVIMNYKTEDLVCLMMPKKAQAIPVSVNITKVYDVFRNMIGFLLIASDYRQTKALHKERNERMRAEKMLIARNLELEKRINERSAELIEIQKMLNAEHSKQKEAEKQVLIELRNKEEMLRELHHRVKNNIQMIISLINMEHGRQFVKGKSDMSYGTIANRIRIISMIHDYLYDAPYLAHINLRPFVDKIIGELRGIYPGKAYVRFNTSFEQSVLSINQAIPCGIIIFELLSNSLRHAFHDRQDGSPLSSEAAFVNLEFVSEQNRSWINISDNGKGMTLQDGKPGQKNIGLTLVELLVNEYLHGNIYFNNHKGTGIKVDFECAQKQDL